MILSSFSGYGGSGRLPNSSSLPQSLLIDCSSALLDRSADFVTPLRPRTVVIADVVEPEQIGKHKPGVARALADAAINHGVGLRFYAALFEGNFRPLRGGLETCVFL